LNYYDKIIKEPYYLEIRNFKDNRGTLATLDMKEIPFPVKRIFTLSVNNSETIRGGHAHKKCWQAILANSNDVVLINFNSMGVRKDFLLNQITCLIVPPLNWCELHFRNVHSFVTVLASDIYDQNDYIYQIPHS